MRIDLGGPVVAELRGEECVWERLHLVAPRRFWRAGYNVEHGRDFHACKWPPLAWPTLCGLSGYVYAYDGLIRRAAIRFCPVCLERANRDLCGQAIAWEPPEPLTLVA